MRRHMGNCRCSRERISRFRNRKRRRLLFVTRRILDPDQPTHYFVKDARVDEELLQQVLEYWQLKLQSIEAIKARFSTPHAVLQITK